MIAKTKDKKEQGDMMIAAAKQFQQEHNGKLPSVMDMAHQLDTSQWTIYHMLLQSDTTMHWKRLSTAYREKFRMASKYAIDPIKVAGSTDKAKKRAVVLFNMFVDKQFMDVTA